MFKLVLGIAVFMVSACQIEESGGEAKVTIGGGKEQDNLPIYAEFKLIDASGGDATAHVAVKIIYKGKEPVEMHVKDLREEAKANPVEELLVSVTKNDSNGSVVEIIANSDTQIFGFRLLEEDNPVKSRYFLALTDSGLVLGGKSTEMRDGSGKQLTEEDWDKLTQETPVVQPTPAPLTKDEDEYLRSKCLYLTRGMRRGPAAATRVYFGNNCSHAINGLYSPDVVRYMIEHGLMCSKFDDNFSITNSKGELLDMAVKNSEKTFLSSVVCSDTENVKFYMEDSQLHVDIEKNDGAEGTYIFREP